MPETAGRLGVDPQEMRACATRLRQVSLATPTLRWDATSRIDAPSAAVLEAFTTYCNHAGAAHRTVCATLGTLAAHLEAAAAIFTVVDALSSPAQTKG